MARVSKSKVESPSIIAMSAPVTIVAGESGDEKKGPAKFNVLAYTGGILPGALKGAAGNEDVIIDLAGMDKGKSLIANLDHETPQRVGHVSDAINDGKSLTLSGVASAATAARNEVVDSAADGFVWQASVEATPTKLEKIAAGRKVEVNGQSFDGPIYVARKSSLRGFAFVSHGADDNTIVSIAASAASHKEQNMDEKLKVWIEAMLPGTDIEALSAESITSLKAQYDGKSEKRPVRKLDEVIATAEQEEARRQQIADITAQFISDNPQRDGDFIAKIKTLAENAIEAKWTADKYDTELLRASRPQAHTVFSSRGGSAKLNANTIEAAICMTGGLPDKTLQANYDDETLQTARDKFRNGIGLKQLYRILAREHGYFYDGDDVTVELQNAAFGRGRQIHAGISTLSTPGILSNTANKFLLEGWGGGEMVWRDITNIRSVRDFKQVTSYKLSGNFKYLKVGPGGELKHGTVSEDSYTNQADTYGRMFAITRNDIINDDLGALTSVPLELGIGANDAFNEVFWTEFLDNGSFFASGNNNLSTGVYSYGAGIATLADAERIFMLQTKPNSQPLGIMPTMQLVPAATKRVALAIQDSSKVVGSTGPTPDTNTFQGDYPVFCSVYLSNSAYTGYSTVKWYLLAKRPGFAVIDTAFLNGREAPVVETAEASFDVLGVQMRAYHDFGTKKMEYRAGVQGSGA